MNINIGIASIREREGLLHTCLKSLDHRDVTFHLYLNGYPSVPKWISRFSVGSLEYGAENVGDRGKFHFDQQGYCFSCDDDIEYPPEYIDYTIEKIDKYKKKSVITYGGRILPDHVESYYRSIRSFHFNNHPNNEDRRVHLPLTGVMAWHGDHMTFPYSYFKQPNMADIYAGILAQEQNTDIIFATRPTKWFVAPDTGNTIHRKYAYNDSSQTELVNSIEWRDL